ncbi:hypothetical protein A7985_07620 [Pseudoalteromonas luteoviolacea]|uniref:DUF4145 domain-containing protein n=1 Tax=Pseudoalteromonas luteoviolacea TaxID=43657 RepID=A0A1C0TWV9_9GAMM|nr:hypothetical protein [Pseudoalteromonas luteoviolacea]MBQ4810303.1 hypothetical protein [Pseudoalteromonas luteoviolacea]OCQ23799.1 hypothetical protein A7985_07620 [Pseudoalteromonas luteoviolacea]
MFDPFLENDHNGIPVPPTREQWAMRDEQLGRQHDSAVLNAQLDTNTGPHYYLEYNKNYDFYFTLTEEMERCFRNGCWIATICVGSAAIDAFFNEVFGLTRAKKVEEKLKELKFPHIGTWKLIRDNRNNIVHITEDSNFTELDNYELHYIAKKTLWFVHYFCYYIGFNES